MRGGGCQQHGKVRRLHLEINGKDFFQGLSVCKPKIGSAQSVLKKKETLRILVVKSSFLRRISPAFLASKLVKDDHECQGVWTCDHCFLSPSKGSQRVINRI